MDQQIHEDVAVIKTKVEHLGGEFRTLKNKIMGDDDQGGIVGALRQEIHELRTEHKRLVWILIVIAFVVFGSGSGTVSLKSLLEVFKAIP